MRLGGVGGAVKALFVSLLIGLEAWMEKLAARGAASFFNLVLQFFDPCLLRASLITSFAGKPSETICL